MSRSGGSSERNTIRVEVRLYGETARMVGESRLILDLPEGSIVRDVVADLCRVCPAVTKYLLMEDGEARPDVNLLLNGRPIRSLHGLKTRLKDADRLFILRAYGGG